MDKKRLFSFGWAWIALSVSLAIHVTDEAFTDFLSVYNPTIQSIRRRFPLLPLPTFPFNVWLSGLILGIILLLALSPFAFRGVRWITPGLRTGNPYAWKCTATHCCFDLYGPTNAGCFFFPTVVDLLSLLAASSVLQTSWFERNSDCEVKCAVFRAYRARVSPPTRDQHF